MFTAMLGVKCDHRTYEERFGTDKERIASDWKKVGDDIRKVVGMKKS